MSDAIRLGLAAGMAGMIIFTLLTMVLTVLVPLQSVDQYVFPRLHRVLIVGWLVSFGVCFSLAYTAVRGG